jgi:2-isopropylmalate synthase
MSAKQGSGNRVYIFDTTLRDGEQAPGASMNLEEKLMVARQLERLGVDVIEAGFPIASEGDFEAVRRVSEEIRGCQIAGLARTDKEDIERAWQAVEPAALPRLHVFIATSDIHLKHKLKKTREEVLKEAAKAVELARKYTDNVEFSCEDATRSDPSFMAEVVRAAIKAGATFINIPDTVGYIMPDEYADIFSRLLEEVPELEGVVLSVHCHDDLGLAVANSLAGIRAGARQVECTINGIGERAGNAALEEIVMAMRTRHDFLAFETGINTDQIYPASRLVRKITGIVIPPNKAVVGANAFSHEAGIHQDGVLKEKLTYEIMTPESVGIPSNKLVMGKHSGRHAFRDRMQELGFELSDEQLNTAFKRFKALADKKKEVFDEDLETLVMDQVIQIPQKYRLEYINVTSGTEVMPTASVRMEIEGVMVRDAEFGDGPVDAAFKTIAKLTGTKSRLLLYSVNAITGGTDAQGEVRARIEEDGIEVTGFGAHTDIIVASAKAYIDALNRLEYKKQNLSAIRKQAP